MLGDTPIICTLPSAYLSSNTSIDIESTTRNQAIDLPSTSSTVVNEGWDTPMQQIQENEVIDLTEREESIEVIIHLENDKDEQQKNIDVVATSHLINNRPPIAVLPQCDFDDVRTAQRTQSSRHLLTQRSFDSRMTQHQRVLSHRNLFPQRSFDAVSRKTTEMSQPSLLSQPPMVGSSLAW
jgi:hypothetical protein